MINSFWTKNINLVKYLIEKGADVNQVAWKSTFYWACEYNFPEAVKLFLSNNKLNLFQEDIEKARYTFGKDQQIMNLMQKKLNEQTKN